MTQKQALIVLGVVGCLYILTGCAHKQPVVLDPMPLETVSCETRLAELEQTLLVTRAEADQKTLDLIDLQDKYDNLRKLFGNALREQHKAGWNK